MTPIEPTPPETNPRPSVLIVDDQPEMAALVALYLHGEGIQSRIARTGEQARAALKTRLPDLILLDVLLPDANGFDLCAEFKTDKSTAMVPIVLITSLESKADRISGIKAGCDEFLSKPVNRDELRARVASLLKLQAAHRALDHERRLVEEAKRAAIQQAFERYVSPGVVEQILRTGDNAFTQNNENRRDVVALFADMRGFTRMSETLLPAQVVAILNDFFSALTEVAHRHNGTVLSMAGDCLLIGFGVPFALADIGMSSLLAARDMVRAIAPLKQRWQRDYGVEVGIGIGMNRGEVIVGNIGSQSYMSYTIIGDAVNVAARLTDLAGPGEILLTQRLCETARSPSLATSLINEQRLETALKGKTGTIRAYRFGVT